MALSLDSILSTLDGKVAGAVSFVDLVDKVAEALGEFGSHIPGVGPEVTNAVKAIDDLDKALHGVKDAIGA